MKKNEKKLVLTLAELIEQAEESKKQGLTPKVSTMGQALSELTGSDIFEGSPFFVVTTGNMLGACAIAYGGVLKDLHAKLGNILILPSSKHEVLVLREGRLSIEEALNMVTEINHTEVSEEDRLGDFVLTYDGEHLDLYEEG